MALESNGGENLLGNDDDFAALDSMAFTGSQSQFGMNTVAMNSSSGGGDTSFGGRDTSFGGGSSQGASQQSGVSAQYGGGGGGGAMGDGRENGFSGVSGSLFDRIRARTAEQQKQSLSSQSSQQQQQSSEPTMELERNSADAANNAFDAAVANSATGAPGGPSQNTSNNETTYSFSASAGEDFSQSAVVSPPRIPVYGASRDDPYYTAGGNQQQHPSSMQDRASAALAQTGETMKSLWGAGVSGAQAIGAMAQDKMGGGGASSGGGGRSYNNNFLLGEDDLERGSEQRPPPVSAAVASGSDNVAGASEGQGAYSMINYGKTFCEDMFAFVMQLPTWGKGLVAAVMLWVLYVVFG
eukprot:CAMPEP_0181138820 /NCGR_PEP_ID=MMETSP1071-20121207/34449_1 /TAXON_ID=35127 /ORGANISM="Thalassiosira sp., Strain NH16" /LENGTH=353 /DNA_ID=CAMNT_0023225679 /DNA_START=32 /DNA_END=1094 /DNA_ORIENTATION=+